MKSFERRHKHLTHTTPHKLRHTGATLEKQSDVALEQISETLTHSDTNITRTYVNTPNVIQMPIGEIAYRKLSQKESDRNGINNGGFYNILCWWKSKSIFYQHFFFVSIQKKTHIW